jgi:hypothetical protein
MNTQPPAEKRPDPLETALAARKPITVQDHESIRREMLAGLMPSRDFDDIDVEVDLPPGPARRRKDSEVSRVLSILDEIGKDGTR